MPNKKEKNELLLTEINQYHAVVKDFSNQSLSIRKLSITIYITFLSLFFAVTNTVLTKTSFFVIGLSISTFCYMYEIYIDYIRQKVRRKMENVIIDYERNNGIEPRKQSKIIIKFFCLEIYRNEAQKVRLGIKYSTKYGKLYVNIVHSMYIIYLIEVIITFLLGGLQF